MTTAPARSLVLFGTAAGLAAVCGQALAQSSVVNSPHNLSASGPGPIRAASEDQVCIFCHAPHNASPVQPLWNRAMPIDAFSIYTSRALNARPGQPTGTSKMCLSCHDGTIALGAVFSRDMPILISGGVTTMPHGRGHIGTDLRDDHPISFVYDRRLTVDDPKLIDPARLPQELRFDANREMQCTTCHDAHDNSLGSFLVMDNLSSQLCVSCHNMGQTTIAAHSNCSDCHQPHTAPSGPYLLKARNATDTCLRCHDGGTMHAADIASQLRKFHIHDTDSPVDPPLPLSEHTGCTSCHDPHTMSHGSGVAPAIHPSLGRTPGVNLSGAPIAAATTEFEVCFKCHADQAAVAPAISRRIAQNNTRLEFAPGAISFHPIATQGRNMDVPSLRPGWTTASMMYCSDCHAADGSSAVGGSAPDGVHGSNFQHLLTARYDTDDFTAESQASYALCYQCHDRQSILEDRSFPEHKKHIVDERTPCSACHDAHGISSVQGNSTNNSNLINFDTSIVQPNSAGRMEFRDLGVFRGECFLNCHGEQHSPERYGF